MESNAVEHLRHIVVQVMGLRETVNTEIAKAMETDLKDAVFDFVFTTYITSGYDVDAGAPVETTSTDTIRGFVVKYVVGEIVDVATIKDTAIILIMSDDATIDFLIDMKVTFNDKDFKINGISRDPASASWKLWCRGI